MESAAFDVSCSYGLVHALHARRLLAELRRIEVGRDLRDLFLVGNIEQPHDEEERHHRRHQVGERDLPRASMVSLVLAAAAPADDDDLVR